MVNKRMKNVIITGGQGFLGSNTVRFFLSQGVHVLSIGRREQISCETENMSYLQCDVFDPTVLKQRIPTGVFDTFIHFAWAGNSGSLRTDYELQMENVKMTIECMKAAKELGCSRFLCVGSIMEREVEAAVSTRESRPGMAYIYGMAKYTAHCFCKSIAADIGIDLIWPMITNAYGPGEKSPRFINTTLRKMIKNEPLQFTAATQNYDFIYVTDVARAFYLVAEKGRPFCEYLIGSGSPRPLKEYILEMKQITAPEAELQFGEIPFTGTDLPQAAFSIEDIVQDTGFHPEVSFADGIRRTAEWLKES